MAKRTLIDKAISELEAKKMAVLEKAKADLDGIEAAIDVLRRQDMRRLGKPRVLTDAVRTDRKTAAAGQ